MTPKPPVTSCRLRMAATSSSGVPMTEAPAPAAPRPATCASSLSGSSTWVAPGRPRTRTVYSLCQRCSPSLASFSASFLDSARCQLMSTRQFLRSTVVLCSSAASSANDHCKGSACSPSVDVEAIESTPMPYLPAIFMPEGLMEDAVTMGISSCSGRIWSCASRMVNQSLS